jgi:hypothetical protein
VRLQAEQQPHPTIAEQGCQMMAIDDSCLQHRAYNPSGMLAVRQLKNGPHKDRRRNGDTKQQ